MTGLGFTEDQVQRYARHIILSEIGGAGQRKLLDSAASLGAISRLARGVLLPSHCIQCFAMTFGQPFQAKTITLQVA